MDQKKFVKVSTVIFAVVAAFHAWRFFAGWGVAIYTFEVPLWWSIFGVAVAGYLAWSGYKFWKH